MKVEEGELKEEGEAPLVEFEAPEVGAALFAELELLDAGTLDVDMSQLLIMPVVLEAGALEGIVA